MTAPVEIIPITAPEPELQPQTCLPGELLDAGDDERLQRLADELRRQLIGDRPEGGC